jgi:hypothetical protein
LHGQLDCELVGTEQHRGTGPSETTAWMPRDSLVGRMVHWRGLRRGPRTVTVLRTRRPSWRTPYKKGPIHREHSYSSSLASHLFFAPRSSFFLHPPRPPGSSPCSSAHGRGWEEFSPAPAGSRAGPMAGLGLPKLGLAGLGANLRRRVIQDGRVPMVLWFFNWFCLCDSFTCAIVLLVRCFALCGFPLLWFSSFSSGYLYLRCSPLRRID